MTKLHNFNWKPSHSAIFMTGDELISHVLDEDDSQNYVYWTRQIKYLGQKMMEDIDCNEIANMKQINATLDSINVWIGKKGSTARLHYDPTDNFFIQVKGEKKWTLFSPELMQYVPIFPHLHPNDRQSQISAEKVLAAIINSNIDKNYLKGKIFQFVLKPGDILYLPPFWFHEVEALTASISVNEWSKAFESKPFDDILTLPLPFQSSWSDVELGIGLKYFLFDLAFKIFQFKIEPVDFFAELWILRYSQLFGSCEKLILNKNKINVTRDRYCPSSSLNLQRNIQERTQLAVKESNITERFFNSFDIPFSHTKLQDSDIAAGIKKIQLGHYSEFAIHWLTGIDDVSNYICGCLCHKIEY